MEEYENGLTSETITNWINSDAQLSKTLSDIENVTTSIEEQAEMAFHRVSELYGVPKYPEDVDDEKLINGHILETSVYEQLGFLKYLEPDCEMLKGNVISAIYFLLNGTETDLSFVHSKYISEKGDKNQISGFGFKNEGSNVELVFVKKGQSWFDLGCRYFTKYV